jgi:magnesium transporter
MALHETEGKVPLIVWREARIGLLLGTILGMLALGVAIWLLAEPGKACVVGLSVFFVVSLGTVWGSMLPIGLKRLGMDPALMSNPLIAALSDMLGVVIYYNMAGLIVGRLAPA